MSSSQVCEVRSTDWFEKTYTDLKKSFYTDRNIEERALIEDLSEVVARLRAHPRGQSSVYSTYAYPPKSAIEGCDLCRIRFRLSQQDGAAAQGRLMYLYSGAGKLVQLLWIYNHAQYENRPPDKAIKAALRLLLIPPANSQ